MRYYPNIVVAIGIGYMVSILTMSCVKIVTASSLMFQVADAKKPELTSTALKVNKVYNVFPPHDMALYDILEVNPNATAVQIQKSYRILSRRYHPDKQEQRQRQGSAERLQQIQTAYEILSNDSKRLPYHRYGLIDPNLAALLLLGPRASPNNYYQLLQQQYSLLSSEDGSAYGIAPSLFDKLDHELLHIMGYDESASEVLAMATAAANSGYGTDPAVVMKEHRVHTAAALLLESIRPLVEGRLDPRLYAQLLSHDCDRWKRLPLGAQIIRSVGRAYRHEGREFLQRHSTTNVHGENKLNVRKTTTDLSIGFRRKWRSTKDILDAAAVSGRLALAERSLNEQERKRKQQNLEKQRKRKKAAQTIEYEGYEYGDSTYDTHLPQMDDFVGDHDDEVESLEDLEEEQKELEKLKAQQSLISTLQIEALWKVCKIDLDRIIRQACELILSGEYFFFPSQQSSSDYYINSDGWVTNAGTTIDSERAKVAAAEAMVMIGEIMVQQSKKGTSWKQ